MSTGGRARLSVLQSVPRPHDRQNPYLSLLAGSLPEEAGVVWFTWRQALLGRYDLVHAHWPELALRAPSRGRRVLKRLLFALWLLRLTAWRTPIVRTVHNASPHDAGDRTEAWLLRRFDARTSTWIAMNDATPVPAGAVAVVIPHGHYRDWFASFGGPPQSVPGRLLHFGLLRPYKGVDDLLHAFAALAPGDAPCTLHIVGSAVDEGVRGAVTEAVAGDERISAHLAYVGDEELHREIGRAQLVVLPFRTMLNSGTMLLALSLGRPVLVPRGPVADGLADEVGAWWVQRFDAPLDAAQLSAAIAATTAGTAPAGGPDLHRREWDAVGARLFACYSAAAGRRHPRRYSE